VVKALDHSLNALKTGAVTAEELERAKTQIMTGMAVSREKSLDRALDLVKTTILEGEPRRVNTRAAGYLAVTAADVQRMAKTYLKPTNRAVIYFLTETMKPKTRSATTSVLPKKKPAVKVSKGHVKTKQGN
jgi:zinc protease